MPAETFPTQRKDKGVWLLERQAVSKGVLASAAASVGQDESRVWVMSEQSELPCFPKGVE